MNCQIPLAYTSPNFIKREKGAGGKTGGGRTHRKHHPRLLGEVRLPAMPEPQVADHHTAFSHDGLAGGADGSSPLEKRRLNAPARAVSVGTFLVSQASLGVSS